MDRKTQWEFGRTLDCLAPPGMVALPVHTILAAGLDAALATLPPGLAAFARGSGFKGEAGQLVLLPGPDGLAGALWGVGPALTRWSHAALPMRLPPGTAWKLDLAGPDGDRALLGFCLGAYHYRRLTRSKRAPALLAGPIPPTVRALAEATWLTRDLINTPANLLGPAELADATLALARRHGAIEHRIEHESLNIAYPAIAAVGRGSGRPPVVARFEWRGSAAPADAPHLSLCGKGVCFDTGGYDLKPSSAMLRMKKDMGGAALMLGLASAIMVEDLPVRLSVRIGCVENMVSGEAMRPMDVLQTRRGLTVEVGNTDAEGRLVLCDLLAEASDEAPDLLLNAATLTGAARVALGPDIPALFTPDDSLAAALSDASARTGDPLWRLPLYEDYDDWLSSVTADVGNVSSKPHAGAVLAALFLQRFVAAKIKWAHLDTYAWNDSPRAGRPEGGEAQGLQALFFMAQKLTFRQLFGT